MMFAYMMPSLFSSGVMESAVGGDHQEQIGGTGHTKESWPLGGREIASDVIWGCQKECIAVY